MLKILTVLVFLISFMGPSSAQAGKLTCLNLQLTISSMEIQVEYLNKKVDRKKSTIEDIKRKIEIYDELIEKQRERSFLSKALFDGPTSNEKNLELKRTLKNAELTTEQVNILTLTDDIERNENALLFLNKMFESCEK